LVADLAAGTVVRDGITDTFVGNPTGFGLFEGSTGDDVITMGGNVFTGAYGDAGDDTLIGSAGYDQLEGGEGDDFIEGGAGGDAMWGHGFSDVSEDNDTLAYITSNAAVNINLATGAASGGHAEGDTFDGFNNVVGSIYNDQLTGDDGDNRLTGGDGNDDLFGSAGADVLFGGAGIDTIHYTASDDGVTVNLLRQKGTGGDAEGDIFTDVENVTGSEFADVIAGSTDANVINGGGGRDYLRGREGDDFIYGGDDRDQLRGDLGADYLDGGEGKDLVFYTNSNAGISIDLGAGTASGGHAAGDTLVDIESIRGSFFADVLTGDDENNLLEGSGGGDTIDGGAGVDQINGGNGFDTLTGGSGADRFVFNQTNWGVDTITDFEDNVDRIDMRGSGLTFADLVITSNGGNAKVRYLDGPAGEVSQIVFTGIDNALLTESDFIF